MKCKKLGLNMKQFDLNQGFDLKNNTFDYAIANQVIEHLYFTDNFMKEIYRVLKPKGILIISSTNLAALHTRLLLLLGFMPNSIHPSQHIVGTLIRKRGKNPLYGHKSLFTGKALKEFCEIHKFKILHYRTESILLMPKVISKPICRFFDFGTHVTIVAQSER
jgi:2-polyprenyl-3-methyl-5-hydroxy-6-metoxy-1,4-benzoquinol methylase